MAQGKPKLISKKTGEVSAYHDSAIFYTIKGCSVDKKQEGLPNEPYGIIPSHYNNPFTLSFDESELTVSIAPGILHVYGRQVELTETTEVYDFHSTVESQLMYCTVFIEISLEDMTAQVARLKIDIAGAGYKNFDANMIRDNLHQLGHGVFQAPIARFKYNPTATTHFSDAEIVMPTLEGEARGAVREIRITDEINGVPLDEIANLNTSLNFNNWKRASNVDALARYNAQANHNENTGGYSVATTAEKLGNTAINSSLTNVFTVKRYTVISLSTWFGTYVDQSTRLSNIDTSKIHAIRLWFSKNSFKVKVGVDIWNLWHGFQWARQYTFTETVARPTFDERWIKASTNLCLWFHYQWDGHNVVKTMGFGTQQQYNNDHSVEGNALQVYYGQESWYGDSSYYGSTKYKYMDISVEIGSNQIRFNFTGHGYSRETENPFYGKFRFAPLEATEDMGVLYMDIIYKGDVRLQ